MENRPDALTGIREPAPEKAENSRSGGRVVILDTLRGAALLYMLFFHTLFDLAAMFGVKWSIPVYIFHNEHIVIYDTASFVLMAGMTVLFSRDPAQHGARLLCVAAFFPIVTAFFFEGSAIYFGVLHLIACGMLVYAVIRKVTDRVPWWAGTAACALLFALTFHTVDGRWGLGEKLSVDIPAAFTANSYLYPYGFLGGRFSSADYLPLLPWLFLFLAGCFAGRVFKRPGLPSFCFRDFCPPLSWLGRHSLIIYIVHQPVIYGLLYLILGH